MADIPNRPEYQSELFKKGLEVRRDVLGADYVDGSLARADDFNAAFQQMTTEVAWGMIWTRPGLDRKTRSMINLAMLSALNRGAELRLHLRAALTNGVTRDEIKEILLQIGAYCGIPACLEAFKIATEVFKEVDEREGQRLMADKPSVGFVGVGNMGWPMAACLVKAGFTVHVNDSRREVANNFVQQIGGDRARHAAPTGRRRRTWSITMLPTSVIVEHVLASGDDNVFAGMKPGTVVIEMSSGVPSVTQRLAERVAALGGHMIDAPVSGGVPRAKTGELAIMVGGDGAIIDSAMPVLSAMGTTVLRTGARRLRPGDEGAEQSGQRRRLPDRHRGAADRPAFRPRSGGDGRMC